MDQSEARPTRRELAVTVALMVGVLAAGQLLMLAL
jgi:hypothetical protein